jgi:hypothetical protein
MCFTTDVKGTLVETSGYFNVMVEWLALQLRIREVRGLNLCLDIEYPDIDIPPISLLPPDKFYNISNYSTIFPSTFSLIH